MNVKHLTAFAACLAVFGCSPLSGPDKGVSSQYSVHLTGRVLDNNGNPMANTVVKLKSRCLWDTTDAKGCYCVSEKKGYQKLPDPCRDSLEFCKDSQTITKKSISNWIDTLPDLLTVQRDIYGSLSSVPKSYGNMTATITGADSTPQVAQLWYNVANQSYSGFVYFVYSADPVNYTVCVNVYNTTGVLTGRSVTVTFPSKTAGDINVPGFDPNNACAGKDSTVDTVTHDTVTHTPRSPGLVAWWSFDSGAGNTFYDITGNGYNASWTGTGIGTAPGVKGQALSCTGSGFEITVANSCNNFNFAKYSIEFWCYCNVDPSQNSDQVKLFSYQSLAGSGGATNGYAIYLDPDGQLNFSMSNVSYWLWDRSSTLIKGQKWYFVTCTYDSAFLKIYINGALDATLPYQGTYPKSIYDARIACERRTDGSVRYPFNGKIDEMKIYNYALPADSVLAQYNACKPGDTVIDTAGLLVYYPFNGNANDESGHGFNATVSGAALTTDRFGNPNKAYFFNGSAGIVATVNTLLSVSKFTIAAWFKSNGTVTYSGVPRIASVSSPGQCNGYYELLYADGQWNGSIYNSGNLICYLNSSPTCSSYNLYFSTNATNAVTWHHGAITFENGSLKFYIDGIPDTTINNLSPMTQFPGSAVVQIGYCEGGGYFNGSIDEIRIYNRALSDAEINKLYSLAK